eukprot:1700662-Rhodomonas_salina.1
MDDHLPGARVCRGCLEANNGGSLSHRPNLQPPLPCQVQKDQGMDDTRTMMVDATSVKDLPGQLVPETHRKAQDRDVRGAQRHGNHRHTSSPCARPSEVRKEQHHCPQQHLQGNDSSDT